ncbi:glycosyl hydrolase family 95 catalytic domain-containing protein [Paractinoplanes rishiriensis]|uniref:glycosyl hydrolase family 95 catalytic domain-containing protein n=1 Tax=Paractinoplanes rishiriensis TaxID=1050105 RepID=UPI003F68C750
MAQHAVADDPQFAALLFQFGRYLLISSSRRPGWSNTRGALVSPPGATYALACSLSYHCGRPSSAATDLASSSTTPCGWNTASMSRVDRRASYAKAIAAPPKT